MSNTAALYSRMMRDIARSGRSVRYDATLLSKPLGTTNGTGVDAGPGWRIPLITWFPRTSGQTTTPGLLIVGELPLGAQQDFPNSYLTAYPLTWDPRTPAITMGSKITVADYRTGPGGPGTCNTTLARIDKPGHSRDGTLVLFFSSNDENPPPTGQTYNQVTYQIESTDWGATWGSRTRRTEFETYYTPGSGASGVIPASGPKMIQLKYQKDQSKNGRILASLYNGNNSRRIWAWSDDYGVTWTLTAQTLTGTGTYATNETSIVEDIDGTIYASCRTGSTSARALQKSTDSGATFTTVANPWLTDPACEADMCRWGDRYSDELPCIVHSWNPNTQAIAGGNNGRQNLSLGITWEPLASVGTNRFFRINPMSSATNYTGYSSVAPIDDEFLSLAYETTPGSSSTGASINVMVVNKAYLLSFV